MIIKRKPITEGLKKVVKRIKEVPFDNRPRPKPTYIELSKSFAALGGVKGATKRAIRRVRGAAKSRLESGLISQEAVDRITNREVRKARQKSEIPLRQDITNAITNTTNSIKNIPQTIKNTTKKTKGVIKELYENTGDVTAKTAGWVRKNPDVVITQGVIAPAARVASTALGPATAAAYNASPVGAGTLTLGLSRLLRNPNKVVTTRGGKKVKRGILSATKGNKVERAVKSRLGGKSIKRTVDNIRSEISYLGSPIQLSAKPSYSLARVTM